MSLLSSSIATVVTINGATVGPAGGTLSGNYPDPSLNASITDLATFPTNELWVDKNRTDTYTPDGTILKPFLAIQDAIDSISSTSDSNRYAIHISSGLYLEQLTLKPFVNLIGIPDTVVVQCDTGPVATAPSSMGGYGCSLVGINLLNNGTGNAVLIQGGGSVAFYSGVAQANDSEGALVQAGGFILGVGLMGFFSTQKSGCVLQGNAIGVFSNCIFSGNAPSFYDLDAGASTIVKYNATNDFQNRAINVLGTKIFISYAADMFFDYNISASTGTPNTVVTGSPGDIYINKNGGAGTTLWVKESGTGTNTGWVGK